VLLRQSIDFLSTVLIVGRMIQSASIDNFYQSVDPRSTASIDGRIDLSSSSHTPRRAGLIDHRRPMPFACYRSKVIRSISLDQLKLLDQSIDVDRGSINWCSNTLTKGYIKLKNTLVCLTKLGKVSFHILLRINSKVNYFVVL
jgi:hypothetical protein